MKSESDIIVVIGFSYYQSLNIVCENVRGVIGGVSNLPLKLLILTYGAFHLKCSFKNLNLAVTGRPPTELMLELLKFP